MSLVFSLALSMMVSAPAPELIVDVDFNDEVMIRPEPITEAQVERLVHDLHDAGATTLLVRMGYLGYLPYRTKLSYPVGFDAEHARRHPYGRDLPPGELEEFIKTRQAANERYCKVIETFNPPEVFLRVGHELGMKVVMWIDIFDDMYSGHRSKFLDENPHCQWTARDGKTHFQGLVSYAWPESRAFRVAQAKELLDLGADGIHCSTSAHCRHLPNVRETDAYGFEQPVVDEFRKRYGVDIRTAADFDKEAWHADQGRVHEPALPRPGRRVPRAKEGTLDRPATRPVHAAFGRSALQHERGRPVSQSLEAAGRREDRRCVRRRRLRDMLRRRAMRTGRRRPWTRRRRATCSPGPPPSTSRTAAARRGCTCSANGSPARPRRWTPI